MFDSHNWLKLLSSQPQFADKCTEYKGWEKFDSSDWSHLLSAQPQLWIYCPEESVNKIKKDPTNANGCKCWDWFKPSDWSHLLSSQPQFTEKVKEFEAGWVGLLQIKPELANECECWEKFDFDDWSELLYSQPQFADKCTDKMYDQFSQKNWAELEAKHPGVFEEKHMLSTLRKLAK